MSTFTNTTRIRKLYVNVFLDQIAGNGAYVCYITIQRAGAGSAYETIRTTKDVASGVTAIVFNSMPITLNATDVMKTYVIGLAGDTTTPDIIVDVNEEWINIDTSGNVAIGTGGIDTTSFAAGAIDAAALAQDGEREMADEYLNRDIAGGASGGARNVRSALRASRNHTAIVAGVLTVYEEDDTTPAWTATVTTTAGNPISAIDPA